jgi:dTDP-4-dehydrorhamnose reductase
VPAGAAAIDERWTAVPSEKLLILGASSHIGRYLYSRLGPERAIGTYSSTAIERGRRFDLLTMRVKDVVRGGEASHAVVLCANTSPDSCFRDPAGSRRLNVAAMQRLIFDLWELGITPIFASSESVFDGMKGDYIETDEPRPIFLYAQQKKEMEDFLLTSGRPYLCLRIARVYGDDINDGTLLSTYMRQLMANPRRLRCAVDQAFSPVYIGDVARAITRSVERGLGGVYHLSGGLRYTRLALLESMLSALARYRPLNVEIEPCSLVDFNLLESRPLDISMRNDRLLSATGLVFRDVNASIEILLRKAFG